MFKASAGIYHPVSTDLAADVYINASQRRACAEIKAWLRERSRSRGDTAGRRPTRKWAARRSKFSACPDQPTYRDRWHCSKHCKRLDSPASRAHRLITNN